MKSTKLVTLALGRRAAASLTLVVVIGSSACSVDVDSFSDAWLARSDRDAGASSPPRGATSGATSGSTSGSTSGATSGATSGSASGGERPNGGGTNGPSDPPRGDAEVPPEGTLDASAPHEPADADTPVDAGTTPTEPDPPPGPLVRRDPGRSLEIDFSKRPTYLDAKDIVLTFDDGPDEAGNTATVLDILKQRNIKASFFVNTAFTAPLATSTRAQETIRRIVAEGHELANHSAHHYLLNSAKALSDPTQHFAHGTTERIRAEVADVEGAIGQLLGGGPKPLTLFRAPQGLPYSSAFRASNGQLYTNVTSVVRQYAVHVGWNIDSNDWQCASQGDVATQARCVHTNIVTELDAGSYGIILMHSVGIETVTALPTVIDTLTSRGYRFKTVEDAVRGAYGGKTSAELMTQGP